MLSAATAARIEQAPWFQARCMPYLLVDTQFRIRAVNAAYQQATGHPRARLIEEQLFDAFPDNPRDSAADGVANLSRSLESVFSRGIRHWMGVQRYDVPNPCSRRGFIRKVWTPVNSPIREGGKTVAALHHVQDVTAVLSPQHEDGTAATLAELRNTAEALRRGFPGLPAKAVLGILADSHRVVAGAAGEPDPARAQALTRLRLEILAGHPAAT